MIARKEINYKSKCFQSADFVIQSNLIPCEQQRMKFFCLKQRVKSVQKTMNSTRRRNHVWSQRFKQQQEK